MQGTSQEKYTVAFVFDETWQKVLLVHKEKPEWQKGKVNGIGGKYEAGETGEECIRRETREEASLDILEHEWLRVGTIRQSQGNVGVYAACYKGALTDAVKSHHEEVEWFETEQLPDTVIPNVRWLIPISREKLKKTDTFSNFVVEY